MMVLCRKLACSHGVNWEGKRGAGLRVVGWYADLFASRISSDHELNIVLLRLTDYLGYPNDLVIGAAWNEVCANDPPSATTLISLLAPRISPSPRDTGAHVSHAILAKHQRDSSQAATIETADRADLDPIRRDGNARVPAIHPELHPAIPRARRQNRYHPADRKGLSSGLHRPGGLPRQYSIDFARPARPGRAQCREACHASVGGYISRVRFVFVGRTCPSGFLHHRRRAVEIRWGNRHGRQRSKTHGVFSVRYPPYDKAFRLVWVVKLQR